MELKFSKFAIQRKAKFKLQQNISPCRVWCGEDSTTCECSTRETTPLCGITWQALPVVGFDNELKIYWPYVLADLQCSLFASVKFVKLTSPRSFIKGVVKRERSILTVLGMNCGLLSLDFSTGQYTSTVCSSFSLSRALYAQIIRPHLVLPFLELSSKFSHHVAKHSSVTTDCVCE